MPTPTFHLSHEDRATLEAAAEAENLGPSSYARRVVMAAAGRHVNVRRKPNDTAVAVREVLGALGKIGGNVNQLARHSNLGGRVPADALAAIRRELECLTTAVLPLREPGK